MTKLNELDATDIADKVRKWKASPVEVMQDCIVAIEAQEDELHAWAHFDKEQALTNALAVNVELLRKKARPREYPLAGVPVGIKDIFNTVDMPTQMGSPIWAGFTPGNDARVVHYLRRAGAIIAGKTVTAEFAVHTPGPTRNPHNVEYMAGTSSTGSAVAVAAKMVPLALGTQTAGSTIRPASYCGVYGFKPTFGLVPRTGMLKTTDTLDTVGMFARSARDLRLLFDVIRVQGRDYPYSNLQEGRAKNVRLIRGPKWGEAEGYVKDALLQFPHDCCEHYPMSLYTIHELHGIIYDKTLAYYFMEEAKKKTLVSPKMYEIIERGNQVTLDTYKDALVQQAKITAEFDEFMRSSHIDILLDYSTAGEALKGLDSEDRPDHCLIWTFLGLPVVSVPMFTGPNGLPFGVQVIGRKYDDYKVLAYAEVLGNA